MGKDKCATFACTGNNAAPGAVWWGEPDDKTTLQKSIKVDLELKYKDYFKLLMYQKVSHKSSTVPVDLDFLGTAALHNFETG